jgi:hypothetical protein
MKAPTFLNGAVAAALLAVLASAMLATVAPFLGFGTALRLAVPVLAGAYLLYFFRAVRPRTGRVVCFVLWTALAVFAWFAAPPLPLYLLLHAGAVWLLRSLYAYSGVIPALMDLGLCALSVLAFGWVFARTGGVFLATWSYLLVQALWVASPTRIEGKAATPGHDGAPNGDPTRDNGRFEHARRQADEALRQLFSR